jgi:hypothetical protein
MTDLSARPDVPASSPSAPMQNPGDARDLRQLLEVVLEAVTLTTDIPDYERRILDRALWVRATLKGALTEDPANIGWDVDYLRSKLAAEETDAAERAARASVDRAFPAVAATEHAEPGEGQ